MSTVHEAYPAVMSEIDIGHLFAFDALACCARCLLQGKETEAHVWSVALSAIETAWDVALPAETRNRKKPGSISQLYVQMHGPTEWWLPYSQRIERFGKLPLAVDGKLNSNFNFLFAEYGESGSV